MFVAIRITIWVANPFLITSIDKIEKAQIANYDQTNVKIFEDCADKYTQPDFTKSQFSIV